MQSKDLTTGPISKHVLSIAVPASFGLVFQTMYNVVDSFYAGQISTTALAAMGVSFPVFLLVIAASGGLSRGTSALIANAIGSSEPEKEKAYIYQALSLGVLVSLFMAAFGLTVASSLFVILGAEGEYLDLAMHYMRPIFLGSVFFVLVGLSNAILLASGDSKTFSRVLIIGFFANLILDPWFLYGGLGLPPMGIAGIAWATVIIQLASTLWMIRAVVLRQELKLICVRPFIPKPKIYLEILTQAIPASFNILSVALGFFVINYYIKPFGKPTVAAFGVGTRIEQIGLLPTFGLYAAIMALVGQNNGAKKFDRVVETLHFCNKAGLLLNSSTSLTILIFAKPLMRLFTDDEEVINIGLVYLYVMMFIQWSYVLTSTHLAALQAIKRPNYGFLESVLRKVLLPLTFIVFTGYFYGSVEAIWYSVAAANVLMTIVTLILTWRVVSLLRPTQTF